MTSGRLVVPIGLGAVVGVVLRWGVFDVLGDDVGQSRTLFVNAAGCLLMGLFVDRHWRDDLRAAATIGFCGGLTTFSTFALDAAEYLDAGRWPTAAAYIGGTTVVSAIAYVLGRQLISESP